LGRLGLEPARKARESGSVNARAVIAIGLGAALTACALPSNPWFLAALHPRLLVANAQRVPILAELKVDFGQPVDPQVVKVRITPAATTVSRWAGNQLFVAPVGHWATATDYAIRIAAFQDHRHNVQIKGWQASFRTQPALTAALFLDGHPVTGQAVVGGSASILTVAFPLAMQPAAVQLTVDGKPLGASAMGWQADRQRISLPLDGFAPGSTVRLSVDEGRSDQGDLLTAASSVTITTAVLEPSNPTSGVASGFVAPHPLQIVVENSGPARPQVGLQGADMVFEYISEYSITRMTAVYFNTVPPLIGPVRSCRMVNIPLTFAFGAITMCSGASDGTLGQLWHQHVPVVINDYDRGGHFFRSSARVAPHNLYTSSDRALRLRTEMPGIVGAALLVDPAHDDLALGEPAGAPQVPLHAVSYRYDDGRKLYLRFDHGSPFLDAATRGQLAVKTVVVVHVPFRDAGWVEDTNGGAHSIIYDLAGQGPAELYSDGRLIKATWHMSQGVPIYFTDASGRFIHLNAGLTWIHLVGNGQSH